MNQLPVEVRTSQHNSTQNSERPHQILRNAANLNGASQSTAIGANGELASLEKYSIEDVVEFKISRFLDQIGSFFPDDLHDVIMSKVEKPLIAQILRRVGGNQVHASKILGINRNTLRKKMKIYGL